MLLEQRLQLFPLKQTTSLAKHGWHEGNFHFLGLLSLLVEVGFPLYPNALAQSSQVPLGW